MRNTYNENIQEHSLQVAIIAHALSIIKNKYFGGCINAERVMVLAVFHEVSEIITGDLATPIKYFNPEILTAYKGIEEYANKRLIEMLPNDMKQDYHSLLFHETGDEENWMIVKAADKICSYIKCIEEIKTGNREFSIAERTIREDIRKYNMPEVKYFMDNFLPSFYLTIDELG